MLDVKIGCLRIEMEGAAGHEHRVRPIASRAAQILAQRLQEQTGSYSLEGMQAPAVSLDLNSSTDEDAARAIANSWLQAVAMRLP